MVIMRAMQITRIVSLDDTETPLEPAVLTIPEPQPGEIQLRVTACGVCHTELDEIEGRTPPPKLPIVPGHQIVGRVAKLGSGVTKWRAGDRVGVGWIHSSTGEADENLSEEFRATGRDSNGGYSEYTTVPADYAYAIPEFYSDAEAAPLLCAGAVGYRALKLTNLRDGEALGLTGFGGSNHLVLQLARHQFPNSPVYVFARDPNQREFARELGAAWAGDTSDRAPQPLDAIIDTTPAWKPIVEALANLKPGGRLVINAIRKEDRDKQALLDLRYHEHLWMEREIKSVANVTHFDLAEFLPLAAAAQIRPEISCYPLEAANQALVELKQGGGRGAKVLEIG
jgi:alcohol dehydrogenase, propanol-preferring